MRQVTWFNPPWSSRVRFNIGRKFLQLLDKHFPKGSPLRKICNRNCVKLSYSTTKNMSRIIAAHNAKTLSENKDESGQRMCNCRNKEACPLQGKCLQESVVYEAGSRDQSRDQDVLRFDGSIIQGAFQPASIRPETWEKSTQHRIEQICAFLERPEHRVQDYMEN